MSKESREIERLNPNEEVGKKRKIVFWSMIATGIGVIVVIALLLIFLIPKDEKFDIDLGSNVSVEDGTLTGEGSYKKGDSVTIVAEDIDGYRFTGWSYGGSIISTDKEYTFPINEENEGEYTANYAKIYTVSTFDSDNYGSFTVAPTEAIAGETVTVRYEVNSENQDKYQLKRLYYVVAGESDQVTIENNAFTMPEGNVTIYAEFNNLYNINLTTNIDEEVNLTGEGTYIENETVTISAPNIAGYRFRNWTYNGDIVTTEQEYAIANIDSTTSGTYIANYDRLYSIAVNSSHGTVAIVDNKTNAIENENIEFTVEPNSDYRLIEVKVNNETLQAQDGKYSFTMPAENVSIVVTYIQQLEVILQSDMENADLSGADTYDIGSEVTITASTYVEDQDGNQYRFIGWQHNEEFIPAEDGGIYTFTLSQDTAGTYTAIYESGYKVEVEENSAQYIQIESTQAFEDDNITFTASIEDTVSETEVIIKSIKIMANGEEIEYTNDGNQYSFIMPAGNVLISVVEETRANIIKGFVISGNRIIQYTGPDSEVVVPSKYYAYQQESDGILEFDSFDALNSYMQQELGRFQIGGGYFTYKLNDSEYSKEIKDAQAWLSEMQKHSGDSEFNLTIKLPTEYTVTEDALELGDDLRFPVVSPFYQLYMSSDYIISFTYQIGDGEIVSVDANNIVEIVDKTIWNRQPETMLPIKFTNIKYGKVIACEGDTNVITSIGDEAFANCSNLTNISIPNSIAYIGDEAFANCSNLTNISIPNSITYIGNNAFSGCSNLKYEKYNNGEYLGNESNPFLVLVDVIDTAASEFNISVSCQIIYDSACNSCSNLTTIDVPEGVISIGTSAFNNCISLATVTFAGDSQLASIGNSAFINCSSLTEITLPASLTSIGSRVFFNSSGSIKIYYQGTMDQWLNMTFGELWTPSNNNINLYINDELADEITINNDIPSYAFYGIDSITKVTLGEGVTGIGSSAFYDCGALQSIELPSSLTSIGSSAFSSCSNLATVTFAEGSQLKSIGDSAFSGCSALTSITLPSSLTSIGGGAFSSCSNLATVTFAEGSQLKSIGDSAFSGCSALASITIPASVTSIGDFAFYNCTSLATVTIEGDSQLESKGDSAFSGCNISGIEYNNGRYLPSEDNDYFILIGIVDNTVTSFEIMKNCQFVESYVFRDCLNLTEVVIPASLTSIGSSAFSGCSNLATVTFAEGSQLESIGSYAFFGCSALQSIELPSSLTSIGSSAFSGCSNLATVTFAEGSQLESIGSYAFSGCGALQSIELPESVTGIGSFAFSGCSNLATVTIESDDIYKDATSTYSAGYLLQYATTVRVLTTIVDTCDNSYLENTSNFTTSTSDDGKYTVFTKVQGQQ